MESRFVKENLQRHVAVKLSRILSTLVVHELIQLF